MTTKQKQAIRLVAITIIIFSFLLFFFTGSCFLFEASDKATPEACKDMSGIGEVMLSMLTVVGGTVAYVATKD